MSADSGGDARSRRGEDAARIALLEAELAQARELARDVQRQCEIVNLELQASNEEVTSANDELRRINEELARAHHELTLASRAKDEFLATLSHELRTPLTPIMLLASEAADNPGLTEQVRTDFATIRTNIALEARLIDDLLDLTRVARGKLHLEMQSCDVHAVLRDALAVVASDVKAKGIHLVVSLEAESAMAWGGSRAAAAGLLECPAQCRALHAGGRADHRGNPFGRCGR